MNETPEADPQLNQLRSEADTILFATESATNNPAWQQLVGEEQSSIEAARVRLVSVKQGDDSIAIREAIQALDQATQHIAEAIMEAAVESAIRGG